MKGIIGYSAYLPAYRISRDVIAASWQTRSQGGQKLCARFDEDSLTMAATATADCLASLGDGNAGVSGLFFASTTAPYLERMNASIIAAICDHAPGVLTADLCASLRAGTSGLAMAFDRVAGMGGAALICAADTREAEPGTADEQTFGDAAAAVAVGDSGVIAELVGRASVFDDFFETTRRDRDVTVNTFDGKFSLDRGYHKSLGAALQAVMKNAGVSAKEIARLVVPSPDKRSHLLLAKKLGFSDAQVQGTCWEAIGQAGCPLPLLLLGAALDEVKQGELILLGGYGNGADAFLFRATEAIGSYKPRVSLGAQLADGLSYATYNLFRKARKHRNNHDDGLEITNVFYTKEEKETIRLRGNECGHCGTRHFPQTKVCAKCEKWDAFTEVPLQRTGQVFSCAVDHLAPSPLPPVVMAVVDLDGGGRFYGEVVDTPPDKVGIDMPVELVIRRVREGGGLHHYYWKCRSRRG